MDGSRVGDSKVVSTSVVASNCCVCGRRDGGPGVIDNSDSCITYNVVDRSISAGVYGAVICQG